MGLTKTGSSQSTTTVTPTPEERQLEQLQLGQAQAFDPIQRQLQSNAGNLVNNLLTGQALPGYLQGLPGGISPDVTNSIVNQSLRDLYPQFQSSGVLDSGAAAQIAGRTSADIRNQAAQFNIQNLMQLLNLGVGGQAQVQAPSLSTTGQLGQSLAGLRTVSGTTSTYGQNPFLSAGIGALGGAIGGGLPGAVGGLLGGFLRQGSSGSVQTPMSPGQYGYGVFR